MLDVFSAFWDLITYPLFNIFKDDALGLVFYFYLIISPIAFVTLFCEVCHGRVR